MKTPLFAGYIEPKQSSIRYKFNYQGLDMLVSIKNDKEVTITSISSLKEIDDEIRSRLDSPDFRESIERFIRNNFCSRLSNLN